MQERITINVKEEARAELDRLSAVYDTTITEILRRSIGLMSLVQKETAKGGCFLIERPGGKIDRVIWFW